MSPGRNGDGVVAGTESGDGGDLVSGDGGGTKSDGRVGAP